MEISIRTITLFASIILTGLSAGLFYAWAVSVIPGTKQIQSITYMETMQSINKAIINPAFFLIFFGSLFAMAGASFFEFSNDKTVFTIILLATFIYLVGTLVVTVFGNVPLNEELEALRLNELSSDRIENFRNYYETKWNRLHMIRTAFSLISLALLVIAALFQIKN